MAVPRSVTRLTIILATTAGCHTGRTASSPAVACTNDADVPAAVRDRLSKLPADLSNTSHARDATEDKAVIARLAPGGFAGLFVGRSGRLVVLLTDTSQRATALPALDTLLRRVYHRPLAISDAEARPARWNFAVLYAWFEYVASTMLGPDVPSVGIDEADNRILIGARDEKARDRAVTRLNGLGLPCKLVNVRITGPVVINRRDDTR